MSEIPKLYEPQAVEPKWYAFWEQHGCFTADPARVSASRPAYSIVIPPPNVTGVLTLGHVLNNTIQDILARKARMDGKEVLWLPGTDHAGIATQNVVEKTLRKEGVMKHRGDLGREALVAKIWEWKEKYGGIILKQLRALGCSCDWTRTRFTMDPEYSRCVQEVFVDLYRKGLIYRGKRMVNWCPASLTALSDEEVVMKEQKGFMYHFRVEVVEAPGTFLTIATTRPETIPADTAVAVNPKDPRYRHLIGKRVYRALPLDVPKERRVIPIIADEQVDFEFGTGVLKVTPAHDRVDFEIGLRHKLPVIDVLTPDGKMTAEAGADLAGLDRFVARKKSAELLEAAGALEKAEPYVNHVGFSERADVPIEPRLSEQWFLKYPSVEAARNCVAQEGSAHVPRADSGVAPESSSAPQKSLHEMPGATPGTAQGTRALPQMRFFPDRWAKVYDHWMGGLRDWCISRQLWWGHRIPVWYSRTGLEALRKTTEIVRLTGRELSGATARDLRRAAWELAGKAGFLRQRFKNRDTGWEILVDRRSLEHAFSNRGLENIRILPGLPDLLRHAVLVATEPHMPPVPQFRCVHVFMGAVQLGAELHRVKFTVKERNDGRKLYDHQATRLKSNEADGESPGTHPLAGKLVTRPASASHIQIARLIPDVNTDPRLVRCQTESPGPDWIQDPDVLDTWFSSWLWPFATMGWTGDRLQDSKNPTLQAFYPTTDLVTGPDIIFFWVARMIMAGFEYMGDLPFRNVYFTGIIRDKQGRKMSKSLGNSPDPLDLIAKYGADALRFGVMRAAPLGQDILFDEQNVELGRNFCTKLWNACRFRQLQGGETEAELDPARLTSDDKWILLKLDRAIREVTAAFAEYRFSDATAALYRFFWGEFCDWYLECSKAALASPDHARRQARLAVLDFVLSHTLRLFHPFLPFITEELWHGLGYHRDLPPDQGGRTIMTSRWPLPLDADFRDCYGLDACYEEAVEAKFELVRHGRNLRRLFNLPSAQKLGFILRPAQGVSPHEAEYLKLLLHAETLTVDADYAPPRGTPQAGNAAGTLYLPLAGLIDPAAERARLGRELEKIRAEVAKVQDKLANPNFAQKVPPAVLAEHRQRLADWQAKAAQVEEALAALAL